MSGQNKYVHKYNTFLKSWPSQFHSVLALTALQSISYEAKCRCLTWVDTGVLMRIMRTGGKFATPRPALLCLWLAGLHGTQLDVLELNGTQKKLDKSGILASDWL